MNEPGDQYERERLIVLCTPSSAKSDWVEHEVRTFIDLGQSKRIFPVIGSGEPNSADPDTECFPPALREAGILAADLREIRTANGGIFSALLIYGLTIQFSNLRTLVSHLERLSNLTLSDAWLCALTKDYFICL